MGPTRSTCINSNAFDALKLDFLYGLFLSFEFAQMEQVGWFICVFSNFFLIVSMLKCTNRRCHKLYLSLDFNVDKSNS